MVYDKVARTYVRGAEFKPHFLKPGASRYLAQLRSVADGMERIALESRSE